LAGPASATPRRGAGPLITCQNSWNGTSGAWSDASRWSAGHVPTSSEDACITAAGTYTVTASGADATAHSLQLGGSSGTQTLAVTGICGHDEQLTVGTSIANGANGEIVMSSTGCGNYALISAASLSNAGSLHDEVGAGGARYLRTSVTNTGSVGVNANLTFDQSGTTFTNNGALTVANGVSLSASGTTVANASGSLTGSGSGDVVVSGGTYQQGGGTTSGTAPVYVVGSAVQYTGTGASSVIVQGSSTLSGTIASGQTLTLNGVCGSDANVQAAASFTSAGTIVLTSTGCGNYALLQTPATDSVSNSGTIRVLPGAGGARYLRTGISNTGTLDLQAVTTLDQSGMVLQNAGSVTVATGAALNATSQSVSDVTGGSIATAGTGSVTVNGGSYTQGAGTTSGNPILIQGGAALSYTGSGASSIVSHDGNTISGNLSSGQTLSIEGHCGSDATLTASASFTNAGTIVLTSSACGNYALLQATAGTITNSGTLRVDAGAGGGRYLRASVANSGTTTVSQPLAYDGGGTFTNTGALTLNQSMTASNASTVADNTGGTITSTATGALLVTGSSYQQGGGTTAGPQPVTTSGATVSYTGTGASTVVVEGGTSLGGNVASGQTLVVQGVCGSDATATAAASFSNAGTIQLTSSGCGNFAQLTSTGSAVLTNSGTVRVDAGSGGARYLRLSVTNSGSLLVNVPLAYDTGSTTLTNNGTISIANGASINAVSSTTIANATGGSISTAGSGLVQTNGTFNEGAGTTGGTSAVYVISGVLTYTGSGSSAIHTHATTSLSGNVAKGQTLVIEGACGQDASLNASGSFTNAGTIDWTSTGCGNFALLATPSGKTLTNSGTLDFMFGAGGARYLRADVSNAKTLTIEPGVTVSMDTGRSLVETGKGVFSPSVSSAGYGTLHSSGPVTLAGTISPITAKGYVPPTGTVFHVVTAASTSGSFSKVAKMLIGKKGDYYQVAYPANGVDLVTHKVHVTLNPTSGATGTTVNVSGTDFGATEQITLAFTDKAKAKFTLGTTTTSASGAFNTTVQIPAGAASGAGKLSATGATTTASLAATFTVT
jgi:hypothetical protein